MSEVTNLIISFSVIEDEKSRIKDINSFYNNGRDFKIISADYQSQNKIINTKRWYGGSKKLETPLYIGAFNSLNTEELIAFMKNLDWEDPSNVQLITKEHNSDKFKIFEII
jgi:hypothetical protein